MPSHRARAAAALWIAHAIAVASCTLHDATTDDESSSTANEHARLERDEADAVTTPAEGELDDDLAEGDPSPRGFAALEARVPGTDAIVGGLRIAKHRARVRIRDGFAWTELEEDVQSTDARVLESNYAFALPSDATVARLALWVGDELVEGEMVERARARRIFRGIVDDTVRPRDPALLEWVRGSEVSLSIFPIPSRGTRTVRLAYTQPLAWEGDRVRYVMPLSLGADRAASLDDFALSIEVDEPLGLEDPKIAGIDASLTTSPTRLELDAHEAWWTPTRDLVLSYRPTQRPTARIASYAPSAHEHATIPVKTAESYPAYAAVRVRVEPPRGVLPGVPRRLARVVVIDRSQSQSKETLLAQARVATNLVEALDDDERFAVLACDSACASYPAAGLARPTREATTQLAAFLSRLEPAGASDLGGAIAHAATRLREHDRPQLVLFADGSATAGALHAEAIGRDARAALAPQTDIRLFGAGRTVDTPTLTAIASAIGASYGPLATAGSIARRSTEIASELRAPTVKGLRIELGDAFDRVVPAALPSARVGEVVTVYARHAPSRARGSVRLTGSLDGAPYSLESPLESPLEPPLESPREASNASAIARGWAEATIAQLEASEHPDTRAIVALSREHHVLSRHTALLVLESEAMFRSFGIERLAAHNPVLQDELRTRRSLEEEPTIATGATAGSTGTSLGAAPDMGIAAGGGSGTGARSLPGGSALRSSDRAPGARSEPSLGSLGAATEPPRVSHRVQAPSVRASATIVSGSLPPEVIRRVVRRSTARMRQCYELELRVRPDAQGSVQLTFRIAPSGAIEQIVATGMSSELNACLARSLGGLVFPEPEGGPVRVTYPVRFTLDGASAQTSAPVPSRERWGRRGLWNAGPTAAHQAEHALETDTKGHTLAKLVAALEAAPTSRPRHEALIRGLLVRGRFDDALDRATRFVEADTDDPRARELYAFALAAKGDASGAARAMGSLVEVDPRNAKTQLRAGRAYEAVGDLERACAHFTAARALAPSDETAFEALRCAYRRTGDREAVLHAAKSVEAPKRHVQALIDALAKGEAPAPSAARTGALSVRVTCDAASRCPSPVVVTPNGTVIAPFVPAAERASVDAVALGVTRSGAYRTLLVGGALGSHGQVELYAFGAQRKLPFTHTNVATPVARTDVSL
jgi:Flp pilus assembly protein TadD